MQSCEAIVGCRVGRMRLSGPRRAAEITLGRRRNARLGLHSLSRPDFPPIQPFSRIAPNLLSHPKHSMFLGIVKREPTMLICESTRHGVTDERMAGMTAEKMYAAMRQV